MGQSIAPVWHMLSSPLQLLCHTALLATPVMAYAGTLRPCMGATETACMLPLVPIPWHMLRDALAPNPFAARTGASTAMPTLMLRSRTPSTCSWATTCRCQAHHPCGSWTQTTTCTQVRPSIHALPCPQCVAPLACGSPCLHYGVVVS